MGGRPFRRDKQCGIASPESKSFNKSSSILATRILIPLCLVWLCSSLVQNGTSTTSLFDSPGESNAYWLYVRNWLKCMGGWTVALAFGLLLLVTTLSSLTCPLLYVSSLQEKEANFFVILSTVFG